MSKNGYFVCLDCKTKLKLGKAVYEITDESERLASYHFGGKDMPLNSQNVTLSRAVWKWLAEHHLHQLRVFLESDPEFASEQHTFSEIGGDGPNALSFEEYLKGWPG